MKLLLFAAIFVFTFHNFTVAQTRSRVFDNFDTKQGVQVVTPAVKPIVETQTKV